VTAVSQLTSDQLLDHADALADLLADTVDGGASVGFLAPLDRAAALAWWRERADAVAAGELAVWVARTGDRVTGTVGLAFPGKPNSRHRAELVKLMVHRDARHRRAGGHRGGCHPAAPRHGDGQPRRVPLPLRRMDPRRRDPGLRRDTRRHAAPHDDLLQARGPRHLSPRAAAGAIRPVGREIPRVAMSSAAARGHSVEPGTEEDF
jgi:hypothetical protein